MAHIQGDMDIDAGLDSSLGLGFLNVKSSTGGLDVEGATTLDQVTINTSDAQFLVNGSNKINFAPTAAIEMLAGASSFLKTSVGAMDVEAQAGALTMTGNSTSVIANTTTVSVTGATGVTVAATANNVTVNAGSNFDVNASSAITMDANATSNFSVTGSGNVTVETSAGRAIVTGGLAGVNAVTIAATNSGGGIDVDCGTGGFDVLATDGKFSIDAQNVSSNISLATNAASQDFIISLTGSSDSSILMSSTGTGTDAIKITSSDTTGGIDMDAGSGGVIVDTTGAISLDSAAASNFTVTGAFNLTASSTAGRTIIQGGIAAANAVTISSTDEGGGIDMDAGTGGYTLDSTAGFSIDGVTTSNITLTGTSDLTVNNTAGRLILQSQKAAADAVRILANDAAGGLTVISGTGGIDMSSQGFVSIDGAAGASNFSLATTGAAQDLTIAVTGAFDSSLYLTSTGTNALDAIVINASAGGIDMDATGQIHIDTTNTVNGIFIATATAGVPVTIGTATSLTTIAGDLTVSGTTTTVNTETLVVEDNLIIVNSGGGELGNDGGIVVRRFQTPNNVPTGDVILDTGTIAVVTSTLVASTATANSWSISTGTTLTLTTVNSGVFYVGMLLTGVDITGTTKILSFSVGTGASGSVALIDTAQTNGSYVSLLTGTLAASTLAPDTLRLNLTSSAVNDYYAGMWIQITSGTQINKVRRIKSYNGLNFLATLYMTADNSGDFTDGLDLGGTASIHGDGYKIFNSPYIASFYDESANKWVLAYSNLVPDPISVAGPSVVKIQRYASFESGSIYINDNGDPTSSTLNVNIINEATSDVGVTIEGVIINNGLIGGVPADVTEIVELLDNATTAVDVTNTATIGAYMVMADQVQAASGAGSFLRATGGSFAAFAVASTGIGGGVNRLAGSKGTLNHRVDGTWATGEKFQLKHLPAQTGGTGALIPYRVRVSRVVV